ncbi:type II toxin-antitoxin system HipA family toxin [Paracidovorax valerianellae]|uniref:Serine/threonine-protein kinase HipA n=1 Tax=Paracidovorax valerianellae TaxID=187868 RepID=A0A1G6IBA1_9BURK|nr:HipA domain-containing protein [Paracidovorax valerianellae]MDA8447955.1 HipA domain-containing protein [Paracidovorax valerianellae]SDC03728.1 serine/threonine-protein kinase HipA [Paracidovorax valerianellae]
MSTSIRYLRLYLHRPASQGGGRLPIGYLSQYGDILRVSFDESYIDDPGRPTLSLSYRGDTEAATRQILASARDSRLVRTDGRWPVYFQNLLPEGHNRERLARERRCSPDDEFELLAAAGRDLMGALEVEPVPAQEGVPDVVRHWHTTQGLDVLEPGFVEYPVEDAASLPGVVTKFSAVQEGRRYRVQRKGAAGSVILKLPTTAHPDLVANEYAGYQLCKALGLHCAEASIVTRADAELPEAVPFDDILAVQRFDHLPGGERVHMEEFNQVLGYAPRQKYGKGIVQDYATMLRVLDRLSHQPVQDTREFLSRMLAFILMGNTDAHLKNWALVYPDGHAPQLAPLYDPVCVAAFFEGTPENQYAVNRAIDRTLRAFSWDDMEALIKSAGLLRAPRHLALLREQVQLAKREWPKHLLQAPPAMQRAVHERLAGGVALAHA